MDLLKYKFKKFWFEKIITRSPNRSSLWSPQKWTVFSFFPGCLAFAFGQWINKYRSYNFYGYCKTFDAWCGYKRAGGFETLSCQCFVRTSECPWGWDHMFFILSLAHFLTHSRQLKIFVEWKNDWMAECAKLFLLHIYRLFLKLLEWGIHSLKTAENIFFSQISKDFW